MGNSAGRSAVDVGSVIADTYTIEALIGAGGMGAVFVASHKRLPGKKVAIKLLHAELYDDEVLARFRREAEIASRLGHPNIVAVHDFNITPDGTPYLVLEYLHGETLAQRLRNGPMALDQVFSVLRQVGSALAAAHREGIVHRDLKPQNIFLVPTQVDGRRAETAKVLDFGISKIRGSQTVQTQDSTLLGTPQYMAPEQALGQHTLVDERTDVFALGAIVYEMLSGRSAFAGASIPEVVFKVVYEQPAPLGPLAPTVPPHVIDAVQKAMAKPAADRFQTTAAFVEALTGQPLLLDHPGQVSLPPPDVGFASGSRHLANNDAFAQTMGSDHGAPVPALKRTAGSSSGAGGMDATVAPSNTASARSAGIVTNAPTHNGPADDARAAQTVPGSSGSARTRTGLIIAIAAVCAALAAGVVFFAMRDHGDSHDKQSTVLPTNPPPPHAGSDGSANAPIAAGASVDAAPAPDAAAPADAAVIAAAAPPDAPRGARQPPPPIEPDKADDPDITEQLDKARGAFSANNFELAERLANSVISKPSASPRQRAQARLVHGLVQCTSHNDDEGASIDLRAVSGFPKLRAELLAVCHEHHLLLGH